MKKHFVKLFTFGALLAQTISLQAETLNFKFGDKARFDVKETFDAYAEGNVEADRYAEVAAVIDVAIVSDDGFVEMTIQELKINVENNMNGPTVSNCLHFNSKKPHQNAKELMQLIGKPIRFDLTRPEGLEALHEAETFLSQNVGIGDLDLIGVSKAGAIKFLTHLLHLKDQDLKTDMKADALFILNHAQANGLYEIGKIKHGSMRANFELRPEGNENCKGNYYGDAKWDLSNPLIQKRSFTYSARCKNGKNKVKVYDKLSWESKKIK